MPMDSSACSMDNQPPDSDSDDWTGPNWTETVASFLQHGLQSLECRVQHIVLDISCAQPNDYLETVFGSVANCCSLESLEVRD